MYSPQIKGGSSLVRLSLEVLIARVPLWLLNNTTKDREGGLV